jgi:hypothetical protein
MVSTGCANNGVDNAAKDGCLGYYANTKFLPIQLSGLIYATGILKSVFVMYAKLLFKYVSVTISHNLRLHVNQDMHRQGLVP